MKNSKSRLRYGLFAIMCVAVSIAPVTSASSSRLPADDSLFVRTSLNSLKLGLQTPAEKISPKVLEATAGGNSTSVVILLTEQADVSAAYSIKDQDARGWFVYNTLTQHAERTQASLKNTLASAGAKYESYWIANMLVADADRALVEKLAARADVARVDSNLPTRWIEDPAIAKLSSAPNSPDAAEWGVTNVNAPLVWAMGFTGQGIVVGDLDTGMRWTHDALKPKYRGWNGSSADHNYNWKDAIHSGGGVCGANTTAPCDDNGHGTHTAGSMVGDDGAGNQIGVAPGAKWIGCRNMDQGNGTPATYAECFQFAIAPTDSGGANPNPALRPYVLNNSWGCPTSEGCVTRAELETIVNNTEAAGIFVEASAGNSGPGCSTVSDPPAIYSASFTTGSISITNTLAGSSSRGPSTFYSPNLLKPNIVAPGVSVRSSYGTSDSTYVNSSGTSMAGPHVAGVVALLWSARPALLRQIAATKALLQNTANPAVTVTPQTCGGIASTTIPNNSFGYGRVDALAAVNAGPTAGSAAIRGKVTAADGSPLAGVTVKLLGGASAKAITDSAGNYEFAEVSVNGVYRVEPSRVNYHFSPESRSFTILGNQTDALFTAVPDPIIQVSPIDNEDYFVRQHYLDFLGREPDNAGFNFWSNQISECGADAGCIQRRRENVSAAYFLSIEFQETGGLIDGLYRASYGRRPQYAEFMPDTAEISREVIVGRLDWENKLAANKAAFIASFVNRAPFVAAYGGLTDDCYVDALIANTTVPFSTAQRNGLLAGLTSGSLTRGDVLKQIAENDEFRRAKLNEMFVTMEYFGYLRRDPDAEGFQYWLNKLNQFGGNFEQAEMVKAFLLSSEYRARFPR